MGMIPQGFNESRIAILEEDVVDVGGKVMNIEQNSIVTLEENIEKVNENITKLQENVVKVETNIVEVEGKVTNIEQNIIATLEGHIEKVKGNITKLEENVVKVDTNIEILENNTPFTCKKKICKTPKNIIFLKEVKVKQKFCAKNFVNKILCHLLSISCPYHRILYNILISCHPYTPAILNRPKPTFHEDNWKLPHFYTPPPRPTLAE